MFINYKPYHSSPNKPSSIHHASCNLLISVYILEYSPNLVKSLVILLFASLPIFRYSPVSSLKKLFIFHQSQISFRHLSTHIFEIFKDSDLILVTFFVQKQLIVIFVILKSLISSLLLLFWTWISSDKSFTIVKLFKDFVIKNDFLSSRI